MEAVRVASADDLDGALNSVLVGRPESLMTASAGAIIGGRTPEIVDFVLKSAIAGVWPVEQLTAFHLVVK